MVTVPPWVGAAAAGWLVDPAAGVLPAAPALLGAEVAAGGAAAGGCD